MEKGICKDGSCVPGKESIQSRLEQVKRFSKRLLQTDNFERKIYVNEPTYIEEIYSTCGELGVELQIIT